jgi:hypothetical protein
MNNAPNHFSKKALNKQMLYYFILITMKTFLEPCQFLLAKLSLVKSTLWCKKHMKILIISGTLIFRIYFLKKCVWSFTKSMYKEWTVNFMYVVRFHTEVSDCVDKLMSISLLTKCSHLVPLYPVSVCLKHMFSSTCEKILETKTYLHCIIL